MQNVADSTRSKVAVEELYNAMTWILAMGDCHSLTESKFVQTVLQGLQRSLAKPVVKKLPVTVEMLAAIVEDAGRSGSLADVGLATACVLSYTAFLGFDELVHIKAAEVKLFILSGARQISFKREMRLWLQEQISNSVKSTCCRNN